MSNSMGYKVLRKTSIHSSSRVTQAAKRQIKLTPVNESLLLLGELASELSTTLNFESLKHVLSHKLRWIVDFDRCTLAIWSESSDTEYLLLELTSPSRAKTTPLEKAHLDEGWPGKVLMESKPFIISELTQLPHSIISPKNPYRGIDLNARSLMSMPLRTGERTIGSLNFSSRKPDHYSAAWYNVSSLLASQIGGQVSSILAHQRTALALKVLEVSQTQLKTTIESREQMIAHLEGQVRQHRRLNQLKDEFLSTISHELRAPLANIKMAIHMLKVAASVKRTEHYLQILEDECAREASLISDLLDLQRLEVGSKPLMLEAIHVIDWLPTLVASFHVRLKERQQLQLDISRSLVPVVSDRSSLKRILSELINNACAHTSRGGRIKVSAQQYSNSLEVLITQFVVVRNSGPEIPVEELSHIFERFHRIRRDEPWVGEGIGLGLVLARKLVEQLNGTINVRSQPGQTTFTVEVPDLTPGTH